MSGNTKFYIRTDANETIGSGHMIRCIAIANELAKQGVEPIFLVADHTSEKLPKEHGYQVIVLNSLWSNLNSEIKVLLEYRKKLCMDVLLIDSYHISATTLQLLNQSINIIYIDDYASSVISVSMIIQYGVLINSSWEQQYKNKSTILLTGSDYIPLRDSFRNCAIRNEVSIKKVLLTTGGSDSYHMTCRFLHEIIGRGLQNEFQFYIVVGRYNDDVQEITKLTEQQESFQYYYNVEHMETLMMECDVALTAGGSTLYELCATGCIPICFTLAENQISQSRAMQNEGMLHYVGDVRNGLDQCVTNALDCLEECARNQGQCGQMVQKMQRMVDALGAKRIADQIICNYGLKSKDV